MRPWTLRFNPHIEFMLTIPTQGYNMLRAINNMLGVFIILALEIVNNVPTNMDGGLFMLI